MSPRKKKENADGMTDAAEPETEEQDSEESTDTPEPAPEPGVVPCALEHAPAGAKCVVSRKEDQSGKVARLIDPSGSIDLPDDDLFYTLPAGAKVQKVGPTIYRAYHLGQNPDHLFTVSSARAAVTRYLKEVQ